jgi:transcription initiation factor TFIIB
VKSKLSFQSIYNQKCPRCSKSKILSDVESEELFCGVCGFVISEKSEYSGPERQFVDDPVNKSHSGDKSTLMRHDRSLNTIINPLDKDSNGKSIPTNMKSSMHRLRLWNNRTIVHDSVNRNLQQALVELLKLKEKLSLSDAIVEKASYIYRKGLERKLGKGRTISAMMAASLYASCRQSETPRTLNEISEITNIKRKTLTLCYRMLLRELELKMPVTDSTQCVSRIASKAGLSEKSKRYAIKILKKAEKNQLIAGKDPMGVAATALYLANLKTGEKFSQKEIASASGITEVTIRNRCKNLKLIKI